MSDILAPIRYAAESLDAPVSIFIRNDDAGWDDDSLYRFLDMTGALGLTVDLAAIPGAITEPQAKKLCEFIGQNDGARIHQHGLAHVNHEQYGRKCEFGPSRSASIQQADIRHGKRRLADFFGRLVDPIFTPPWNRCTEETAHALRLEGFQCLSRDATAEKLDGKLVEELSVTVDWQKRKKPAGINRAAIIETLASQLKDNIESIGVMTHHATLSRDDLSLLRDAILIMQQAPHIKFIPMMDHLEINKAALQRHFIALTGRS